MIGALMATGTAVAMGISAGWGQHRSVRALAARTPDRVWFHVHPPHSDLWGITPALTCDGELLGQFAAGLRTTTPPVLAMVALPQPIDRGQRSYAGFAALVHPMKRCVVGVSPKDAPLVPWAAAGCGLLARQLPEVFPAASGVASLGSPPVAIEALPGWIIGTDDSGAPVTVNLPPGSTVLITGEDAPDFVRTLPMSGRVITEDVALINASGEERRNTDERRKADGMSTVAAQWRDAWHPQTCRVIISPSSVDLPGVGFTHGVPVEPGMEAGRSDRTNSAVGMKPGSAIEHGDQTIPDLEMGPVILVDLTIDLNKGLITSGETQIPFHRLPSW